MMTRERLEEIRGSFLAGDGLDPEFYTELLNHAEATTPPKPDDQSDENETVVGDESTLFTYTDLLELLRRERAKDGWIKVEDRLPEKDGDYIVAYENRFNVKYSEAAQFFEGEFFYEDAYQNRCKFPEVYAWRELPYPPMK